MRLATRILQQSAKRLLREDLAERLLAYAAYVTGQDLLSVAYHSMGVGLWENATVSGELFFVRDVLPHLIEGGRESESLFFDVGANKGEYSKLLAAQFPKAAIHSFEPNPDAFELLQSVQFRPGIRLVNVGLGAVAGTASLTVPQNNRSSSHGTLYSGVFKAVHPSSGTTFERTVQLRTVLDYAAEIGANTIDYIKVDTEGHELAVLKGCGDLLGKGAIRAVQFEFNQMNVVSRVFLRDFYELLEERYHLFRLAPHELLSLGAYNTRNEIFFFQNIVAILKPLTERPEVAARIRR